MPRWIFTISAALLISLAAQFAPAQTGNNHGSTQRAFRVNEELVYEAEFSRLLLRGINVAQLTFTVQPDAGGEVSAGPATGGYNLVADTISKGIVVKLFGLKFHQHVESMLAHDAVYALQTVKLDEQGKRVRTSEALFDLTKGSVTWTERDPNDEAKSARVISAPCSGPTQDIVSIFYYLRTLTLAPGQTLSLPVSDSGAVYNVGLTVRERSTLKTVIGKVRTLRIEADLFGEGKLMRGKGSFVMWVSDDVRHVPLKAEIKTEIGTITVTLKRATL